MFRIGQKIVCINDHFDTNHPNINCCNSFPKKGQIYTVDGHTLLGNVYLREIATWENQSGYKPGFKNERFAIVEEIGETTFDEIMEAFLVPKTL
jgi:hypothetical protein